MSARESKGYKKANEPLQFEDTYLGYSDEDEDAFNDETFGGDIPVGHDFNFGGGSSASTTNPTVNYAQAARTKPEPLPISSLNDDPLKPIESLWGDNAPSQQHQSQPKPLSLDEIEAQLTQSQVSHQPAPQQLPIQGLPQSFPQAPNNFFYPSGFIPNQQAPPGYNIPPQFNLNQIPPQQFAQLPAHVQQQLILNSQQQFAQQQLPHQQPAPGLPPSQYQQFHSQGAHQFSPQQQPPQQQQQLQQQPPIPSTNSIPQDNQHSQGVQQELGGSAPQNPVLNQQTQQHRNKQGPISRKPDLSDFPVLGSDEATNLKGSKEHGNDPAALQQHRHHNHHQQQLQQFDSQQQQQSQRHQQQHHNYRNNRHQYGSQHHDNFDELPEEEKQRLIRRQHKIQRISQFSGIMNARDKDFVTRIQLSHIVTEDPYNEDFYFQVHRLLKTGDHNVNNSSIAQAYLDFSGHRLGGRHQRADLALQRMQQQVQKAVTVAKERPRTNQFAKEGALGKVTFSSGKRPRTQLEIVGKKPELPEISKGGRKATLIQLENIYQNVLNLESQERENKEINTEELWESLKLFDDSQQLNPFIQILSFEKGLKIFPRIFHFLNRQQKLTIVTLIFANLSLIKIISKSSFKNHPNDEIPADVQKIIELFQLVVLKPIILFLSYEAVLTEIIGLLTILIEHNNVSFLSTSKLGISLITILLSRAEIIKQEQSVASEDLSHWSIAYDKLFSSLETKLPLVFPPSKTKYDDSYIWQFLASLALSGKINHQRIIVDEIRDEIFGSIKKAKESDEASKSKIINNLNLFLNVIGLSATEDEIVELK